MKNLFGTRGGTRKRIAAISCALTLLLTILGSTAPVAAGESAVAVANCSWTRSGSTVTVSWTGSSAGPSEVIILRSVNGGSRFWRGRDTSGTFQDSYRDGLSYFAVGRTADGSRSDAVQCSATSTPGAPTPLAACSVDNFTITWDSAEIAALDAVIYRSVNGSRSWWRGLASGASGSFEDSARSGEIEYSIRTRNQAGEKSSLTTCVGGGPVGPGDGRTITCSVSEFALVRIDFGLSEAGEIEIWRNGQVWQTLTSGAFTTSEFDAVNNDFGDTRIVPPGTRLHYSIRYTDQDAVRTYCGSVTVPSQLRAPTQCAVQGDYFPEVFFQRSPDSLQFEVWRDGERVAVRERVGAVNVTTDFAPQSGQANYEVRVVSGDLASPFAPCGTFTPRLVETPATCAAAGAGGLAQVSLTGGDANAVWGVWRNGALYDSFVGTSFSDAAIASGDQYNYSIGRLTDGQPEAAGVPAGLLDCGSVAGTVQGPVAPNSCRIQTFRIFDADAVWTAVEGAAGYELFANGSFFSASENESSGVNFPAAIDDPNLVWTVRSKYADGSTSDFTNCGTTSFIDV